MKTKELRKFKERWNELNELHESDDDSSDSKAVLMRLRRAISWLDRAHKVKQERVKGRGDDADTQFIFFWIGFNALYARDPHKFPDDIGGPAGVRTSPTNNSRERYNDGKERRKYFRRLSKLGSDSRSRIRTVMENSIAKEIDKLLEKEYVFDKFWKHHHDIPEKASYRNWKGLMARDVRRFEYAKENMGVEGMTTMLSIVFNRLYTLRNQLMHGGATWKGGLNLAQLREGRKIMYWLIPVFVHITLENSEADWGKVFYPRLGGGPMEPFELD